MDRRLDSLIGKYAVVMVNNTVLLKDIMNFFDIGDLVKIYDVSEDLKVVEAIKINIFTGEEEYPQTLDLEDLWIED